MKEIFKLFLKLGSVGFGGPIALIGYMEEECVKKRKWLTLAEFHRVVSVAKLFPGPLATLIAIRIGKMQHKRWGGWIAGFSLILPSFLMILALANGVLFLDHYPKFAPFFVGLTLAALVVALNAAVNFSKPVFKSSEFSRGTATFVLLISCAFTFMFPNLEIGILLFFGLLGLALSIVGKRRRAREAGSLLILFLIFWGCFRASLFTFGSGIAIVPVLRSIFIDKYHFVSNHQFLQGLTLGQITPGPLVIISTYLGWIPAGTAGAVAATIGTFLPTFIFGIFVMPRVEGFILRSTRLKVFFEWMVAAVCGAIFGSLARLAFMSLIVNQTWLWSRGLLIIFLFALMLWFRLSPGKIFLLGGILAYLL